MPLEPGETFGRYKILALVGQGGMGVVYRAHDTHLDRTVALKVLHADDTVHTERRTERRTDGDSGAARLLREGRAAAAILHPNAVAIFDVGEWEGTTFLAMELVEGRTLRGYVGDSRVPLARRVRWLVEIANALAAAHKRGIVHRDVKPENVIVGEHNEVKVLDFGIARRAPAGMPMDTGSAVPRDSTVFGSPRYMAPEQLRGEPLDGRTDLFAWGVMAYELLTGRHPWEGATTDIELARMIFHRQPLAPSTRNAELPKAIDEVISAAIAKSPGERHASIEVAAAKLKKAGAQFEEHEDTREDEEAEKKGEAAPASPDLGMRSVTTRTFGITAVFAPIRTTRLRALSVSLLGFAVLTIGGAAFMRHRTNVASAIDRDSAVPMQAAASVESPPTANEPIAELVTLRFAIRPANARVVIDGIAQSADGGILEVTGAAGTSKVVVVENGAQRVERAVAFSRGGHADPEVIELPAPAASSAIVPAPIPRKSGAPRATSPEATPLVSPSATTPPAAPSINTTW